MGNIFTKYYSGEEVPELSIIDDDESAEEFSPDIDSTDSLFNPFESPFMAY
jgi:hypothetical protein